ncbi:CoA transferase [Nakamurella alba]|uniref:CoA transferase n=1 Tax=Nakamurella alba TaxID=2665158 RepID=UPI002AC341E9|nr:CoA transferase [Nakamurella alba]
MDQIEAVEALFTTAWVALSGSSLPETALSESSTVPDVRWTGDASLPSRLPVLPALAATIGCSTAAAGILWSARGGHPGSPEVSLADAAIAGRSERYAHRLGESVPETLFAPLSRFWPTSDGWVRLHTNYPWHLERALTALDLGPESPDSDIVGQRLLTRTSTDWEERFAAVGALCAAVRTPQEWAAHPQGRASADAPLVAWDRAAGPANTTQAPPPLPAAGVRVLDLTRVIAGPVATRTLAAWGADVLRIDPPQYPELEDAAVDTLSGKRSATVDLAAGRTVLHELLSTADVLVHGYRPGALDRFGLSAADLRERYPHLAVISLSAWGTSGPWADRRGFDSLVQAASGLAVLEAGGPDRPPAALPAQVLDHGTGYLAAAAAMLAIADRITSGRTSHARLSLATTARWLTGVAAPADNEPAQPQSIPRMVTLQGATTAVEVVAPPGSLGDTLPCWTSTTRLGADRPEWLSDSAAPDHGR